MALPYRASAQHKTLRATLLGARPWLPVLLAACAAIAWRLTFPGEGAPTPELPGTRAPVPDGVTRTSTDRAKSLLSNDDANALCLAAVPADSRLRGELLGNMQRARVLPDRPDVWVDIGQAWMRQLRNTADSGFALNAEGCALKAQQIAPDHPRALGLLASVRLDAHEFTEARALAEALLARDADDAAALGILSDAALELGDEPLARDATQRLMDRSPGLGAYARASYLRWLHGDEPGALELARLAIDAAGDPKELSTRAWTLVQAAHLFWYRGDHEGAEAGYRMALDVRDDYAPALLGLGKVAAGRQSLGAAAEYLTRALGAHPDVETAVLLGDVMSRLGDAVAAAQNEALAEQLGRQDRRALSLFYANRRFEPARAVELARAELRVRGDTYTEDTLAWALYADGQFGEAEQHAERASRFGTRDARLFYHLGAIRLALGKTADARALLERALQQDPAFDLVGAPDARRLLALAGS